MSLDMSWTADVTPIMDYYTERTPGSVMEFKASCIAWHYRDCDKSHGAWQAKQCVVSLAELGKRLPIMICNGNKSIEVRPNNAVPPNLVDVALQKIEERALEAAASAAGAAAAATAAAAGSAMGGDINMVAVGGGNFEVALDGGEKVNISISSGDMSRAGDRDRNRAGSGGRSRDGSDAHGAGSVGDGVGGTDTLGNGVGGDGGVGVGGATTSSIRLPGEGSERRSVWTESFCASPPYFALL